MTGKEMATANQGSTQEQKDPDAKRRAWLNELIQLSSELYEATEYNAAFFTLRAAMMMSDDRQELEQIRRTICARLKAVYEEGASGGFDDYETFLMHVSDLRSRLPNPVGEA